MITASAKTPKPLEENRVHMLYTDVLRGEVDKEKELTIDQLIQTRVDVDLTVSQVTDLKHENNKLKHNIKRY